MSTEIKTSETDLLKAEITQLRLRLAEAKRVGALIQSHAKAIDTSHAVVEFDVDGAVITANDLFLALMGYKLDEVVGRHHRIFVSSEEAASVEYERFWQSLHGGSIQQGEYLLFGKNGKGVWLYAIYTSNCGPDGRPERIVTFATDITDRKRAEEELRNSLKQLELLVLERTSELSLAHKALLTGVVERTRIEELLRLKEAGIASAISGISFVTDDGLILYANEAFLQMWRFPRLDDVIGLRLSELWNCDNAGEQIETRMREDGHVLFELSARRQDATEFIVLVSVNNVPGDEKTPGCRMASFLDVSERRQAEASCDLLRAELTHASRLATVGALTSGIAHEINQPLSVVATWAEVALRDIRENFAGQAPEAILALNRIANAMDHVGRIIHRVKNFARKDGLQLTTISFIEAVEEVRAMVEHACRMNGVRLEVEIDPSAPTIFADRIQVQQVLLNLIRNAMEATENAEPQFRRVNIHGQVRGEMLEVAVRDAGCGIALSHQRKLFEPFFTTKAEGLGLGLSICQDLVNAHGGRIWVTPNADRGITITFTLPLAKDK